MCYTPVAFYFLHTLNKYPDLRANHYCTLSTSFQVAGCRANHKRRPVAFLTAHSRQILRHATFFLANHYSRQAAFLTAHSRKVPGLKTFEQIFIPDQEQF